MNFLDPIDFAELLHKRINNELTEQENSEVDAILAGNPGLCKLFDELHDKELVREQFELFTSFDTDRAMRRIKRRRLIRRLPARIAAVLIPAALLGAYYLIDTSKPEAPSVQAPKGIIAHQNATPILKLSDGQQIDLENISGSGSADGVCFENENGTLIISNSGQAARPEEPVKIHTLKIPNGSIYNIVLSDGTKVFLNSGSVLSFPSRFDAKERRIMLNGEGYFDVTHNPSHPFIVQTSKLNIHVTGTSFNVRCYDNEVKTEATLVRGGIYLSDKSGNTTALHPGQQAVVEMNKILSVQSVDTEYFTAWKDGLFYFQGSTMEDIFNRIGRWYNKEVFFISPSLRTVTFSGKIKMYESLDDVLRKFEKSGEVAISIKSDAIYVFRQNMTTIGTQGIFYPEK